MSLSATELERKTKCNLITASHHPHIIIPASEGLKGKKKAKIINEPVFFTVGQRETKIAIGPKKNFMIGL